jgi:hypothetical protein
LGTSIDHSKQSLALQLLLYDLLLGMFVAFITVPSVLATPWYWQLAAPAVAMAILGVLANIPSLKRWLKPFVARAEETFEKAKSSRELSVSCEEMRFGERLLAFAVMICLMSAVAGLVLVLARLGIIAFGQLAPKVAAIFFMTVSIGTLFMSWRVSRYVAVTFIQHRR